MFLLNAVGCGQRPPAIEPISMDIFGDIETADHIYVLLPGMRDRKEAFIKHGFISIAETLLTEKNTALIAVDAHFGYYKDRSLTQRLNHDVFQVYDKQKITLVGVSLGGFGALATARRYPGAVDDILLIAPFLGDKPFLERVQEKDFRIRSADNVFYHELSLIWLYLLNPENRHKLHLVYGQQDDSKPFYQLIADYSPDFSIKAYEGKHNWHTWKAIWQDWLEQQTSSAISSL